MAVRFQPSSEEPLEPNPERERLAEVIQLRSLLANLDTAALAQATHLAPVSELGQRDETVTEEAGGSQASADAPEPGKQDEEDTRFEATRLLARKAMSSGELRAALLLRGRESGEVDEVIADFEQSLYLDDAGLARALTEKLRSAKGASRSQIRVKLRERKIPDSTIEEALTELSDDEELELLRQAAESRARRLVGLDRQTAQRRLLGYLQRRGWQGEPAYRIVNEVLAS